MNKLNREIKGIWIGMASLRKNRKIIDQAMKPKRDAIPKFTYSLYTFIHYYHKCYKNIYHY